MGTQRTAANIAAFYDCCRCCTLTIAISDGICAVCCHDVPFCHGSTLTTLTVSCVVFLISLCIHRGVLRMHLLDAWGRVVVSL